MSLNTRTRSPSSNRTTAAANGTGGHSKYDNCHFHLSKVSGTTHATRRRVSLLVSMREAPPMIHSDNRPPPQPPRTTCIYRHVPHVSAATTHIVRDIHYKVASWQKSVVCAHKDGRISTHQLSIRTHTHTRIYLCIVLCSDFRPNTFI